MCNTNNIRNIRFKVKNRSIKFFDANGVEMPPKSCAMVHRSNFVDWGITLEECVGLEPSVSGWFAVYKPSDPTLRQFVRAISYAKYPSLHSCDDRCRKAKGHNCECACGGANHGIACSKTHSTAGAS